MPSVVQLCLIICFLLQIDIDGGSMTVDGHSFSAVTFFISILTSPIFDEPFFSMKVTTISGHREQYIERGNLR